MIHQNPHGRGRQKTVGVQARRREDLEYEDGFEQQRFVICIDPHAEAAVTLLAAEQ